jgi:carboxylate-amine ligase
MKPYTPSPRPTLGIEEEFCLVDPTELKCAQKAYEVIDAAEEEFRPRLTCDLHLSILELRTPVEPDVGALLGAVREGRKHVAEICEKQGLRILAVGAHPFSDWRDQRFVPTDHYRWVAEQNGYIGRRMMAQGLHVHVGCDDGEAALYVMDQTRRWVGALLALSANSPFFEGLNTGFASIRTALFGAMPRTGFPPPIQNWQHLENHVETLIASGFITRPGDCWWNIRVQPPLGTVEYRMFDLPTRAENAAIFAAIVQALTVTYQERFHRGRPRDKYREDFLEQNRWMAMRHGLEGRMIDVADGTPLPTASLIERMLDFAGAAASRLGTTPWIERASQLLAQGNGAAEQLNLYEKLNGNLKELVRCLVRTTVL